MEPYIAISTINDFLYCPRSLYMHIALGEITPSSFHDTPQTKGNEMHASIDEKRYSNKKNILQGVNIYSEELKVQGKLDIFDTSTGELIERKARLKNIFEGQIMQLYSEYYCLIEMGYKPKTIAFYSMEDNKKYFITMPTEKDKQRLKEIINKMQNYTYDKLLKHHCDHCDNNIYSPLGW